MRSRILSAGFAAALVVSALGGAIVSVMRTTGPAGATGLSTSPTWTMNLNGWDRSSSPTIADINGDGTPDVVFGHQDGKVRVVSGATGQTLTGWPRAVVVPVGGTAGTAVDSTPVVGDLWKDGRHEIVVGAASLWVHNQQGGVVVFMPDGGIHCVFRTRDDGNPWANNGTPDGYTEPVFSSPAIGDIDGDGYPDIVFGSFDGHIYGINRNCGKILDENVEDSVWSSPLLYDVDHDGRDEIFIGADQFSGGAIDWSGGEFRAIKHDLNAPGHARELWKNQIHDTVWSSPAIGDIDGDGHPEIVVGAGFYYQRDDGRKVFAWHADNGSSLPGWPVATSGWTMSAPALGDLTGDGVPEVVETSGDGWVRAYRGNGTQLWAKQLTNNGAPSTSGVASPIIADMNGDGHNDVGAGNSWGFFVLDGIDGHELATVNNVNSYESAGAVGNFGAAGWKLVTISFNTPFHTTRVQAFSMPAPGVSPPWPMFRRDPTHHAGPVALRLLTPGYCSFGSNPAPAPDASSSHGYWIARADGTIWAKGGATNFGNAVGLTSGYTVTTLSSATGNGYLTVSNKGEVRAFGDAVAHGSLPSPTANTNILAAVSTPAHDGYWMLDGNGHVSAFGNADPNVGSYQPLPLGAHAVSIAATPSGHGYWVLGSDGSVKNLGDAVAFGSRANFTNTAPAVSIAAANDGSGYWILQSDGKVYWFGVAFYGSLYSAGLCQRPVATQIRTTLTGHGYFILAANGRVFAFGDAKYGGSGDAGNYALGLTLRP